MSSRTALYTTLVLLAIGLVVAIVVATPWDPVPHGTAPVPADPALDFTAAQQLREDAFHASVRPPAYLSMVLSLVIALVLGLSPLGARLVEAVASPLGGGWGWQVLLGTIAITAIGRIAVLPLDAWNEAVRRRYGLSTRGWGGWAVDVAKAYGIGLGLTLVVFFGFFALSRRWPEWWWVGGAAGGALLVVVVSFAYPIVVEPVFNRFTSLPPGPLRSSLLEMAARDGVPAGDVLVADASRRTSALNAYVSGFGATRRIVIYDTLLEQGSDEQVKLIVAHELGHAKNKDVLWGTMLGALSIAFAVCLLALLLQRPALLRRAGVEGAADPRSLALVLAVVAVLTLLAQPIQMLVSRRIEARADVHALDLTRDPLEFARMQRSLAVTNISDLDPPPLVFLLFASHPTAPQRIAIARNWADAHHVPEPPPLAR